MSGDSSNIPPAPLFGSKAIQVERYSTVQILRGHNLDVFDLAWSPDGTFLASCSADCTIRIWDVATCTTFRILDQTSLPREPSGVAASAATSSGSVAKAKELQDSLGFVKGLAWDPAGKFLAAQSDDKSVVIWSASSTPDGWGTERRVRDPYQGAMQAPWFSRLSWSPDGTFLATAGGYNARMPCVPLLVRGDEWRPELWLIGHVKSVEVARFSPLLFRPSDSSMGGSASSTSNPITLPTLSLNSDPFALCATASEDGCIVLWRSGRARSLLAVTNLFDSTVHDLAWSPDGLNLIAASHNGTCAILHIDATALGVPVVASEVSERLAKFGSVGATRLAETPDQILREEKADEMAVPKLVSGNASASSIVASVRLATESLGVSAPSSGHLVTITKEGKKRIQPTFIRSLGGRSGELLHSSQQPEEPKASTGSIASEPGIRDTGKRKADQQMEENNGETDYATKKFRTMTIRVPVVASPVNLAAPPIQKRTLCRFCPSGPAAGMAAGHVRDVELVNPLLDKGSSQVRCTREGKTLWEDLHSHPAMHIAAGDAFVALTTVDGGLWAYSPAGRSRHESVRILPPIVLESRPVFLDAVGECVMVITQNGGLYTWNVIRRTSILDGVSVAAVLNKFDRRPEIRIEYAHLLGPGAIPLVATSDLSAYAYDADLAAWIRVIERPAFERVTGKVPGRAHGVGSEWSSLAAEIAARVEDGKDLAKRIGDAKVGPLTKTEHAIAKLEARRGEGRFGADVSRMTFGMVENQLCSSRTLKSFDEYLFWLREYARKLVETVNLDKVDELLDEISANFEGSTEDHEEADESWNMEEALIHILPILLERLVDRVAHSQLMEDRRAGVLGLKGMSRDFKLEVGTLGLGPLADLLKSEDTDVETLKAVLETLNTLCTPEEGNAIKGEGDAEDLGVQFTEILIKDPATVSALLSILSELDFYVRYQSVELLGTLLANSPDSLQLSILSAPGGVGRLMDLLEDKREAIRNAGLLLLITLTHSNADIQKIIAFENAFDRLVDIVLEEGATDGGIVVQDCLQLMVNLLRYNTSNQTLFRESGIISRLPELLLSRPSPKISASAPLPEVVPIYSDLVEWTDQKTVNAILVLELVRILVVPNSPNTPGNQLVMNQAILPAIVEMAVGGNGPIRVRIQSLYAMADLIRGSQANQDLFSKSAVPARPISGFLRVNASPRQPVAPQIPPKPAVVVAIEAAVQPPPPVDEEYGRRARTVQVADEFAVRTAAAYAVQCYLHNNPDGQLAIAATLRAPPADNPDTQVALASNSSSQLAPDDRPHSAGSLLVEALIDWRGARKDPFRSWFAAVEMLHIVRKNETTKGLLAAISVQDEVFQSIILAAREQLDVRVQCGLYSLLCTWLFEFPKGIGMFLEEGVNLQFLIEQIKQSSNVDPLVQGLAAFLLGICLEFNDDTHPSFSRASLQQLVASRVGVDLYTSRMDRLRESKAFNRANLMMQSHGDLDAKGLPELYFDYLFVDMFKTNYGEDSTDDYGPVSIYEYVYSFFVGLVETISRAAAFGGQRAKPKSMELVDDPSNPIVAKYRDTIAKQDAELGVAHRLLKDAESRLAERERALQEVAARAAQLELALTESDARRHEALTAGSANVAPDESTSSAGGSEILALQTRISQLESELAEKTQRLEEQSREMDDLLVCLADADLAAKDLKNRLRQLGDDVPEDDE
ncbi:Vesicle-mediated ER to Golgi transport protein [Gonapodya sp. JEL0774]|nr:Vesicle-mediated ER to Golgi transport protein [Gonapodya sp. JEL0774]